MLPYCGRPIFEGLLRDLTAREYLYFRTFGTQLTTPVAIMTSDAKGNHQRVCDMLVKRNFFGRPRAAFRLFNQPLVPVLESVTGQWVLPEPLKPSMKPGGHGVIWKLMHDHGVFEWLRAEGVSPNVPLLLPLVVKARRVGTGDSSRAQGYLWRRIGESLCEMMQSSKLPEATVLCMSASTGREWCTSCGRVRACSQPAYLW
jgi:hypothetical protein